MVGRRAVRDTVLVLAVLAVLGVSLPILASHLFSSDCPDAPRPVMARYFAKLHPPPDTRVTDSGGPSCDTSENMNQAWMYVRTRPRGNQAAMQDLARQLAELGGVRLPDDPTGVVGESDYQFRDDGIVFSASVYQYDTNTVDVAVTDTPS